MKKHLDIRLKKAEIWMLTGKGWHVDKERSGRQDESGSNDGVGINIGALVSSKKRKKEKPRTGERGNQSWILWPKIFGQPKYSRKKTWFFGRF